MSALWRCNRVLFYGLFRMTALVGMQSRGWKITQLSWCHSLWGLQMINLPFFRNRMPSRSSSPNKRLRYAGETTINPATSQYRSGILSHKSFVSRVNPWMKVNCQSSCSNRWRAVKQLRLSTRKTWANACSLCNWWMCIENSTSVSISCRKSFAGILRNWELTSVIAVKGYALLRIAEKLPIRLPGKRKSMINSRPSDSIRTSFAIPLSSRNTSFGSAPCR